MSPTTQISAPTPIINFACPSSGKNAAILKADLEAALEAVRRWAPIEDELNIAFDKTAPKPKVYGGQSGALRIMVEGRPNQEFPVEDWFYRHREDIEKDFSIEIAQVKSEDERSASKTKYDALLTEFDRQDRARVQSMSKELRKAKRELRKAHDAWTAAEQAISDYRPQSLQEAQELLAFCSRDTEIFPEEFDLKRVMQNAADAIADHLRT
ncbi:hypothetical protein EDE08_10441 [Bradyrhizobium sp. R2.2-H]|jgi:hypothetical protein|uniref:hypothetical protein n=1 Tax=unclassified Bradyrhizobium TaxID=2631580 RepID=UPI001049AB74|nr:MULTISPECIES: hypothetical protein [unclassified Bradyrhizobium]TCU73931.1 hypothetical protein EDE10_104601 [Bradyrhizobium sp. Y-H1]TCU75879.1 hypothetical protein EDE08_10441 [Bradyrhizobium sp. R2.2-H]